MILSLSTNKDDSHKENLLSYKNERILPSVAIYGANAAGKSNLYKAMSAAIRMIRSSNKSTNRSAIIDYSVFIG